VLFDKIQKWDIVTYDIGDGPAEGVVLALYPDYREIRTDSDGVILAEVVTDRREGGVDCIRNSTEYQSYPSYRKHLETTYGFPSWRQTALFDGPPEKSDIQAALDDYYQSEGRWSDPATGKLRDGKADFEKLRSRLARAGLRFAYSHGKKRLADFIETYRNKPYAAPGGPCP
jgi:hypothetical protein